MQFLFRKHCLVITSALIGALGVAAVSTETTLAKRISTFSGLKAPVKENLAVSRTCFMGTRKENPRPSLFVGCGIVE